jgi:hypothetical protein
MTGNGGRRSRRRGVSEAMPLLRCLTKHDMARAVHAARQSLSVHRERHQQAQGATIRAAAAGQDVASRKLILRAFAAKLIADPEGGSKPAPPLRVSEAEISRRPGSHWYDWYAAKFARAKNAYIIQWLPNVDVVNPLKRL